MIPLIKLLKIILIIIIFTPFFINPQETPHQTLRIGKIFIQRNEIFNENDSINSNWFTKTINWMHILTRENTIRSRLLFKEGDIYNKNTIDESARILRAMRIVGDIEICSDTVFNNIINVTIITYDKWTMGFDTSFKHDGGITTFNIKLKDDNFLGNAQSISFNYDYSSDRKQPYGIETIFKEPNLLNNWWKLILQYKANEDLNIKTFLLERPFYSDTTSWALGMYFDYGRNRKRVYNNGIPAYEFNTKQENQSIWYSTRFNFLHKSSISLEYIRKRTVTDLNISAPEYNLDLLGVSFGILNRTYYTTKYVENFGRVEDFSLGYRYSIGFAKNFKVSKSSNVNYYYNFSLQYAFITIFDSYIGFSLDINSYLIERNPSYLKINTNFICNKKISDRNIILLHSNAILGYNLTDINQISIGSQTGLRGYPAYAFNGQNKLLFNIEHRFFSNYKIWIFRIGTVLFFDSGMVWDERILFAKQRFHSSVGFGFRIENTKQSGSGIIRLDFAFNLDQNRFAQIIISSDHLFEAFQQILSTSSNLIP